MPRGIDKFPWDSRAVVTSRPEASLPAEAEDTRLTPLAFEGLVRLLVPFDPWRVLLSLEATELTVEGFGAMLRYRDEPWGESVREYARLLVPGDPYEAQLEHKLPSLPVPLVRCRLARRIERAHGLELFFTLESPNADVLALAHELQALG